MSRIPEELRVVLDQARELIDEIDDHLVALLNRRAREVRRIGEAKHECGVPVYQREREEEIFRRVAAANGGPLDDDALRRLFERILDEARRLERRAGRPEMSDE